MGKYATIASQQLTNHYQKVGHESQKTMMVALEQMNHKLEHSLKLRQEQDDSMRSLKSYINELNKKLTPHDIAMRAFETNLEKLNASSDQKSDFEAKLKRRFPPETCRWIFDQEAFRTWYTAEDSSMLWVSGSGGFGKSVLMAAVIDELRTRCSPRDEGVPGVVTYFFCNTGDDATKKTDRILKHLLAQAYSLLKDNTTETIDKANKLVASLLEGSGFVGSDDAKTGAGVGFAAIYRAVVSLLDCPLFVVVDALDECIDRSDGLIGTLRAITTIENPQTGPKIIVCSRPEADIEESLSGVCTINVEKNNEPDIKLNAELELLRLPGWTAQERALACHRIVTQAGSYFRYVDLALDFLRQPWQRPLEPHLERLPKGVDAFYEQIIQSTPPAYMELLKTSLTWTILAAGTIRVPEVIDAYSRTYVNIDSRNPIGREKVSKGENSDSNETSTLHVQQISTAGANLLLVDSETLIIQQRHSTVADFFLRRSSKPHEVTEGASMWCDGCQKLVAGSQSFDLTEKGGHLSIATTIC
jgi:hypothetical protein